MRSPSILVAVQNISRWVLILDLELLQFTLDPSMIMMVCWGHATVQASIVGSVMILNS